ncbi:phosphatidylcholine transfer protein [Patella vulgata]|uniref:phosphatidylcholine transfer protein n=1 Tax=Patella vulgata TaxID=6465 RepID=UPI00217FE139|nr:phosphatidylcholine transfer protein [Patella vulgata]
MTSIASDNVFGSSPGGCQSFSLFTDTEFENTVKELENPQIEGWDFFTESNDVKIYRLYNEESGLYEYKIYGFLKDVPPKICADVYMDLEYRKKWDSFAKEIYETQVIDKKLIYWEINYPFPMWNRDYVFSRELRELKCNNDNVWVVLAKSTSDSSIPEKSGVIRVDDCVQNAALTSDGKNGTRAYMKYYDNPKGAIPTWLINWGAKTGVPQFLSTMEKACKGYPDYLKTHGKE